MRPLEAIAQSSPELSIVIPARDEADNLPQVVDEIASVLVDRDIEIIIVDDGSRDATAATVSELQRRYPAVRHIVHRESYGKSAAILSGVCAARASTICTLDGDGQNDPRDVPALVALARQPGVGLAAGQRTTHARSWARRVSSRVANVVRRAVLGDQTRDAGCGLKAFPRDVFLRLPYFDTMHRFLPALVLREGLQVRHLDVTDRRRLHGRSKYGVFDRALTGVVDLVGVRWLIARRRQPPDVAAR
jgi:dolichol-phosphate mannosyltransferase